jgi:hypothetical protein
MPGLGYADQRYYVPGAGRFISADRFNAASGLLPQGVEIFCIPLDIGDLRIADAQKRRC